MSALNTTTSPDPRKIDDLRAEAQRIIAHIRDLQARQLDVYAKYLFDLPTNTLASDVIQEIRKYEDELDLVMAEYRRRKI